MLPPKEKQTYLCLFLIIVFLIPVLLRGFNIISYGTILDFQIFSHTKNFYLEKEKIKN